METDKNWTPSFFSSLFHRSICVWFLLCRISGGQKKRLSLAIELLKSPAVLFLDEPTSGLDSASAAAIMDLVSTIAVKFNKVRKKRGAPAERRRRNNDKPFCS